MNRLGRGRACIARNRVLTLRAVAPFPVQMALEQMTAHVGQDSGLLTAALCVSNRLAIWRIVIAAHL